ncbi:hypothetical protein ACTXT7_016289, partial [Hymenolepis weldensis]
MTMERKNFENYCLYCKQAVMLVPVHFVMGFFVDTIASRWWDQFQRLPWPDDLAMSLVAYTHGNNEYVRKQRRTIMRYINLSYVICFRNISSQVQLRFPSEFNLIRAGLATEDELIRYALTTPYNRVGHYSVPITWAQDIILQMRREGSIKSDTDVDCLLKLAADFRKQIGGIVYYNLLPVPLVYTQVATVLTYSFTLLLVLSWQFMEEENAGFYIPIFELLQFIFYVGWLKVAESLINPLGQDEDDFDIYDMIERNMQISYHIVDEMYDQVQPLSRGVVLDTFAKDRRTSFMNHLNRDTCLDNDLFSGSLLNVVADNQHSFEKNPDLANTRLAHKMLRHTHLYNVTSLRFFNRQNHIRLSPVADAFNYGPKNIPIRGKKVTGLFGVGPLTNPSGFKTILDECYSDCHMLVYEAKDPNRKRKMVQILDDLSDSLCRVADLADCIRALHPEQVYQSAANAVCIHVGNLVESLNTDIELYNASLKAITDQISSTRNPETDCDSVDQRVLSLFIEDFEQSGVHLKDISDRQAFLKAASENLELGVEFNRVANSPVILDSSALNGISKDVDWKPFDGLKLCAPFYEAPQQFLRALTYALFYSPVEGQEERLVALLDSRDRMAKSAGKESFLYRAVQPTSLAESPKGVEEFLKTLSTLLSPIATETTRSQLLVGLDSKQELVSPWDVPFLIHQGQRWSGFE